MTSGWLFSEKSYFLKARDGNPKKVFLTGTLLIMLTFPLTWGDRLLAHLNTKRFGTGMNACFQRHATWIVWGQYSNYRWCEQEMEILCGLKVPQRPCRHLFIHKPVSVLRVSNATITLSDMGMIKTCYQMWCEVMCLVIKTLFMLLGVYFVGVFRIVASGLPILSLELNQIFIKSSKKYKNNYNWLKHT